MRTHSVGAGSSKRGGADRRARRNLKLTGESSMGILDLGRYKGIVVAITGFLVFIAIILAVNHAKVGRVGENVVGVNFVGQQQLRPQTIFTGSADILARLKAGQEIGDATEALRKEAAAYDHALRGLEGGMVSDSSGAAVVLPALMTPEAKALVANAQQLWKGYKEKLDPLMRFSGSPYQTPETAAPAPANAKNAASPPVAHTPDTQFNPRGKRLQLAMIELNDFGAASHGQLSRIAVDLSTLVEKDSQDQAGLLRGIQVGGMVAALLLLGAIFFYFARNLRK